jgi:hypothetical protein
MWREQEKMVKRWMAMKLIDKDKIKGSEEDKIEEDKGGDG